MTALGFFARCGHARGVPRFYPHLAFAALAAAACALGASPARAAYVFQDIINNNDVTFNQELGINSAGTIAGYFGSGTVVNGVLHPNKGYTVAPPYGQANFTNENFPGSVQTQVTGINNTGTTVGFWVDGNGNNQGFTDVGGSFTDVFNPNAPPLATSPAGTPSVQQLLGVNNSNTAVGFYTDAAGVNHGYTYTIAGNSFPSPNINDPNAGTAAGQGTTTAAINNGGELAGFYIDAAGITHGFTDVNGSFTTIDPTGSTFTQLLGLNDNGLAVGDYVDAAGVMHGLLYDLANNTFLTLDDPFATATTLNGINDLNQLVGFYVNAAGNTIGLLANPVSAVPEPASLTLFAAGLFGLAFVRRRKA
jgi:hypothetical protein